VSSKNLFGNIKGVSRGESKDDSLDIRKKRPFQRFEESFF